MVVIFDNDQNKNVALECKESVRYLGVIIDNNLSWKQHIDHVAIKISRTVGLICKLQHFLPRYILLTIYRSLVTPYLTYSLMAWGQAYKSYLEKLFKLQKRALRFIYFSERNQHTIPLFIDAGVLPLQFLYYELLANLMFEIRHRNALETFKISSKTFLIFILIMLDHLFQITFTHKVLDSQFK